MNSEFLLQTLNSKGMSMERHLFKTALWFLISACRSEKGLSAREFFDKNIKVPRSVKKWREEYRQLWGAMLLDQINLLPTENKNLLSIAIIESQHPTLGFNLPATLLRLDIIACKKIISHPNQTIM